ncbi:hypothetical protein HY504_02040 [Candidatus Wolfebacteria bacterium]|nr:hypothetical protein [Candidatus Wolfebacteria bacterium]
MTSKKLNPGKKKQTRQFGVILENIDSKLDLVVEGHQVLDKKVDDLRLDMSQRFDDVDYKFSVVLDELGVIRNELKEKVGRDEFVLLEKRVAKLEKVTQKR